MDSVCKLIKEKELTRDRYGNPQVTRQEREVFCQIRSVTRSEFYAAANAGLEPQFVIRLADFAEYDNEQIVEYEGEVFSIIRTYRDRSATSSAIELTVGQKLGIAENNHESE
jgi:SPP1 family predicted phage head-tail adaptor